MEQPAEATWGTKKDLQRLGLFANHGVVLGTYKGQPVQYNGTEPVLCVGPSGSGKTYSCVLPTLAAEENEGWRESVVVHDPKVELHKKTAKARAQFSRVIHLAPMDPRTDCYDPLQAIRLGTDDVFRDTQIVAQLLGDPDSQRQSGGEAEHFGDLGDQVRQGIILHGLTTGRATTLPEVNRMLTGPQSFKDLLNDMMANPDPVVQHCAYQARDITGDELSGVLTNARRALNIFLDPRIAHMVSRSDFALTDLRERRQPLSLYLSIPFDDQDRLRPLSRLILRQIFQYATQRVSPWPHRLLMLTEEVSALGRFTKLQDALDYAREYGVVLCNITQSLNRFTQFYGPYHNFWEGSNLRLVFSPNSAQMAKMIAEETGEALRPKERTAVAHEPFHVLRDRTTLSTEETFEPLLSATALRQLPRDTVLLLHGDGPSFLLKKYHYKGV